MWEPPVGTASCRELSTLHFLSVWSQTLRGSSNYAPIMDDKAKPREVTGLAKVTQPLSGRANTQVKDPGTVKHMCHCVKTLKPTTFPEGLKLSSTSETSPNPGPPRSLSWGHGCQPAWLDLPAWLCPGSSGFLPQVHMGRTRQGPHPGMEMAHQGKYLRNPALPGKHPSAAAGRAGESKLISSCLDLAPQ